MELIYIFAAVLVLDFAIHGSAYNKGMLVVAGMAFVNIYVAIGMYLAIKAADFYVKHRGTTPASQ